MSKDKFPCMFSPQMEDIEFIILQIFFSAHKVLKIGECSRVFPSFSWGVFGHMTCFDQLCMTTIKYSLVLARDYSVMQLV